VAADGVNPAFARTIGYGDDYAIGRPFWELVAPGDEADAVRSALDESVAKGSIVERETTWLTTAGERLSVAWSCRPLGQVRGRETYLICGADVTDHKRHEEELRASRARIVEAGDAERRRLERNLHDGAQQRLVSLSLALRLAQGKLAADPEGSGEILAKASGELSLALEELRELARGIHPAVLTDRGLAAALESLAERAPVAVELDGVPEERLPAPVEAAAFYVVSESLTNVAKYAQASLARVSVTRSNGRAVVEVRDDGVGGADPARGSGLRGLADRVEALDGRLEVTSSPGRGTHVKAVSGRSREGRSRSSSPTSRHRRGSSRSWAANTAAPSRITGG
jgi:PAS domain S-box-containing protein